MPVAAAVVGNGRVATVLTTRDMASESRGPAVLDGAHHLQLAKAHVAGIGRAPGSTEVAEDVRHFQSRTGHDRRRLCRRLVLLWSQPREAIQWAHHRTDGVGGHLRIERGGVELGMAQS
jgi:hypothetical protein